MNVLSRVKSHIVSYLWRDNPGFILVATAMLIMHTILAVDSAKYAKLPDLPQYAVLKALFGHALLIPIIAHWLCVLLVLLGILSSRLFRCLRWAGVLSAALFNMYAVAFLVPAIQYKGDLFGPLAMFALSLNSIYLLKAPKKLVSCEACPLVLRINSERS